MKGSADGVALVTYQPDGKHGQVPKGTTVMEAAQGMGVEISTICGGKKACGKCRVLTNPSDGGMSPITEEERKILSQDELGRGVRLACAVRIMGDTTVIVPESSRRGRQRLQTDGIDTPVDLDPMIKKITLKLIKPTINSQKSDEAILMSALKEHHGIKNPTLTLEAARKLPAAVREGGWTVTVTLHNRSHIIDIEAGATTHNAKGLAVDIGTTKMACYLLDLHDGRLLSVASMMNPQISYGEDILTRVMHIVNNPTGQRELHECVIEGINQMIDDACSKAGAHRRDIYEMTVAGNSVMNHLFLDIPPTYLASSPYTPAISSPLNLNANELGININPTGRIHTMPLIAGFIGSDCVAAILATGIHASQDNALLIDVGTNTEIVVAKGKEMVACSCASGPAFEGAHIKHGMRASSGAIERAWINDDTTKAEYLTVDDDKPRGICGSGLIDLMAELLKAGVINPTGRMLTTDPNVRRGPDGLEYVVVESDASALREDIVLTQKDVRELQKAKAAVYTGASILMKRMEIKTEDVERIYLSGAFGNYLDPENMMTVGMLPEFSLKKIVGVGNAAGTGTRMALLSGKERRRAEEISKNVRYHELAADPLFTEEYMKSLNMPHLDLGRFPSTVERLKNSRFKAVTGK